MWTAFIPTSTILSRSGRFYNGPATKIVKAISLTEREGKSAVGAKACS